MKLKYILLLSLVVTSILLAECKTQAKVEKLDKTEYYIAGSVSEAKKAEIIEKADKGKILFKIHCSGCHGIYSKGRDSIPNFTKDQIDDYRSRTITFQNHPSLRKLSADQFDAILTFLQYRKVKGHHH
ncbi:MAG: c-type cytochrome [Ilyomonas sp.]